MDTYSVREELIRVIERHFPNVSFKFNEKERLSHKRINAKPYSNKKRWIMLDANENYLHVTFDHLKGDISEQELKNLNITYKGKEFKEKTRIHLNDNEDAVELYVFENEIPEFNDSKFIEFLNKHYSSFVRRVS